MENNNVFKYVFAAVVMFLIGYTVYALLINDNDSTESSLDQTSTTSNIQTDLRLAIAEYDTINPILTSNKNVLEISKIIYDSLITLDETYKLEYSLAEEIAKTDERTYVVKVKDDVYWSDGTKFTAYDVKFTVDKILNESNSVYRQNLSKLESLTAVDETTLQFVLTEETAFFEYNLTFPIMCESYYNGEDFISSEKIAIGTGMFKVSEITGNTIKLEKNDKYWNTQKTPTVTEIYITLYDSMGEVYNAFKSGDIDILLVTNSNVEEYIGTLGYQKYEQKSRDYDFLSINTQNSILSDSQVRKALSYIIDRESLVASCLGTGYVSSNFSLDMGNWLYTKDLNISSDTEMAKQILLLDGWTEVRNTWQKQIDGRTTTLSFTLTVNENNSVRLAVAENLKTQFENFGISVTINSLSAEAYSDRINNRNYDIAIVGIKTSFSPSLTTFFGEGNIANYSNQEVTELMNEIKNTTDENVLYEDYSKIYDIYLEEAPYIGLYRSTVYIIYNQNLVANLKPNVFNIYHNIEDWYRQ